MISRSGQRCMVSKRVHVPGPAISCICVGDVMYLNVFGQGGIVLLNSHKAVVDLFDRREYRYRPKLIGAQ